MNAETYNRRPVGKIIVRGNPILQVEKILTDSAMAGMLVTADGSDYAVRPCGETDCALGWISYEHTDYRVRPDDYETPFDPQDTVTTVAGGSFEVYALTSSSVQIGAHLVPAGNGLIREQVPSSDTQEPVAIALESVVVPPGGTCRIHVESLL